MKPVAGHLDARTDIGNRQARPPREVVNRCGPAAREIPHRELFERLSARAYARLRHAAIEEGVGELLACPTAAADDAIQLGAEQNEYEPQAVGVDACSAQRAPK